jgi:5-methylcytosine-specific restriction enzyme A
VGAIPGLRNTPTWETMERGDYILCVYDSTYHYVARVLAKYENERFARRVWDEDENGKTWKYMYFLTEPIEVDQPLYEFEGYLHSRYQGFTRISNERLDEIEEDFGTIEGFIQEILEYEGERLPDELMVAPDQGANKATATYLLIWNPNRWTWEEKEVRRDIAQLEESGRIESFRWSVGTNYRQIEAGDRLFLIRLGSEPRGIFLSGFARGYAYRADHWDPSEKKRAWYVDVDVDVLLNPYDEKSILLYDELEAISTDQMWSPPASGERIEEEVAAKLEAEWERLTGAVEGGPSGRSGERGARTLREGAVKQTQGTRYERNPEARRLCIVNHGVSCVVCGFNFGECYGEVGKGYIHVHHLMPLSEISGEHDVDPVEDMRPICPNCHAMVHQKSPPYTIEKIKEIITVRRSSDRP